MPSLSRTFIKAGLVYFIVGLLAGVLYLGQPLFHLPPTVSVIYPVYIHLLTVGWITQLIMGVVYWMFPKYSKERPRRSDQLGWVVFAMLNAGLIMRAVCEPLFTLHQDWKIGWALGVSAILQLGAGWGFIVNTWGRVKER